MNRSAALEALGRMPDRLERWVSALTSDALGQRPRADEFAPLELLWHLAELEVVFGGRLRLLRDEEAPHLPDWDGARAAEQGCYLAREVDAALRRFREARGANLLAFHVLTEAQWLRSGIQEGVGRVTLDELPGRMAAHDEGHASVFPEL